MRAIRAERRQELNEQSRREAKDASAGRRPRPEWHKNAKPADRRKKRATRTKLTTSGTNAGRVVDDSAEPGRQTWPDRIESGIKSRISAAPRSTNRGRSPDCS